MVQRVAGKPSLTDLGIISVQVYLERGCFHSPNPTVVQLEPRPIPDRFFCELDGEAAACGTGQLGLGCFPPAKPRAMVMGRCVLPIL